MRFYTKPFLGPVDEGPTESSSVFFWSLSTGQVFIHIVSAPPLRWIRELPARSPLLLQIQIIRT